MHALAHMHVHTCRHACSQTLASLTHTCTYTCTHTCTYAHATFVYKTLFFFGFFFIIIILYVFVYFSHCLHQLAWTRPLLMHLKKLGRPGECHYLARSRPLQRDLPVRARTLSSERRPVW